MRNFHLSLLPDLFLQGLDVTHTVQALQEKDQDLSVSENRYRIRILDVSGSMHYDIPTMFRHLYADIRGMVNGDRLTVIKFSGPGQAQVICMDEGIAEDREPLIKLLKDHEYSIGTTEFSGALRLALGASSILNNMPVSMIFFTDGYPVVKNIQEELETTMSTLRALKMNVREALFVAYGNYPNIPVMQQMAAEIGGTLTRAADMEQVAALVTEFDDNSATNEGRILVKVPTKLGEGTIYFSLSGDTIVMYSPDSEGNIDFIPNAKTKRQRVYVLSEGVSADFESTDLGILSEAHIRGESSKFEYMVKGIYASVVLLNQQLRTDLAAEIVSQFLGDAAVLDKLLNAWASREHADLEAAIRIMMARPSKRLQGGFQRGCNPDENTFSMVDALFTLEADKEARFYPHALKDDGQGREVSRMKYRHISRKKQWANPDLKKSWTWDSGCGVPFRLIFTDERGNIGVKGDFGGHLKLRDDHAEFGFAEKYPTSQFRTYNFVVDGTGNIDLAPVSMSLGTFELFQGKGLINPDEVWRENQMYDVNFRAVCTVNRAMAKEAIDAERLCRLVFQEKVCFAKIRVLAYQLSLIESKALLEDEAWGRGLREDQVLYLQSHGITGRHGFRPEMVDCDITDHYLTRTLHVLPAGLSGWSKVSDVIEKIRLGKGLTINEQLQAEAQTYYQGNLEKFDAKIRRLMLQSDIERLESEREVLQRSIRLSTLTIVGTGLWFPNQTSRDEAKVAVSFPQYPNMVFTIKAKQMKIDI